MLVKEKEIANQLSFIYQNRSINKTNVLISYMKDNLHEKNNGSTFYYFSLINATQITYEES